MYSSSSSSTPSGLDKAAAEARGKVVYDKLTVL